MSTEGDAYDEGLGDAVSGLLEYLDDDDRAAREATPEPLTLARYDNGGGRLARFGGEGRILVADFYNAGDREHYAGQEPSITLAKNALVRAALRRGSAYEWRSECVDSEHQERGNYPCGDCYACRIADALDALEAACCARREKDGRGAA